jgi:hypothetical protein
MQKLYRNPAWALIAAFGTYFCMYGFRKPYTAISRHYTAFKRKGQYRVPDVPGGFRRLYRVYYTDAFQVCDACDKVYLIHIYPPV